MSAKSVDIATMLDELNLPLAAARWNEIWDAPEMADYTPGQLFREVLEPQYPASSRIFFIRGTASSDGQQSS